MVEALTRDERHALRMQRKKAIIDERIAQAQDEYGLLIVHTGIGKGKSSSAFGMVARALGHGLNVGVVQFIKGRITTGEQLFFQRIPEVRYHVMGQGYTWETQDRQQDIASAQAAWEVVKEMLADERVHLIVLDELNIALKYGYLALEQVLADIESRPLHQHVVITGRAAPAALIEAADTVTDMSLVKHAFANGVKAQKGIEF